MLDWKNVELKNRLFVCTEDPNNDGMYVGVIGNLEFWKNLNIEWNEGAHEELEFVKNIEGLDVLADMYAHYQMSIVPADDPDIVKYVRSNIFSNKFLSCNKIEK